MNENIPDDWFHDNNHGKENDTIEHNENEGHGARLLIALILLIYSVSLCN